MGGDGLAQLGDTQHGRVLVWTLQGGGVEHSLNAVGAVLVGETLAQIDGLMLDRQAGHDLEHRGAEAGPVIMLNVL